MSKFVEVACDSQTSLVPDFIVCLISSSVHIFSTLRSGIRRIMVITPSELSLQASKHLKERTEVKRGKMVTIFTDLQ